MRVVRLSRAGAVLIEGPKATGKTETATRQAGSVVRLDVDQQARQAARVDPRLLLEGARPRLLDKWQLFPELWDHVRRAVDDAEDPGQFVLTGSATPRDQERRHSGAGRFSTLRLRPMSVHELGASSDEVGLEELFAGAAIPTRSVRAWRRLPAMSRRLRGMRRSPGTSTCSVRPSTPTWGRSSA